MGFGEIISLVALLLSILIAYVQYRSWKRTSHELSVKFYQIDEVAESEHIEAFVTNISSCAIYVEDVLVGQSYVPWMRFCVRRTFTGTSAFLCDEEHCTKKPAEGVLQPGNMMQIWFTREMVRENAERLPFWLGVKTRVDLMIEHSGSESKKFVRLP